MPLVVVILVLCGALAPLTVAVPVAFAQRDGDSVAVTSVVEGYHRALASGDSVAALGLLTKDVLIIENGAVESLDEYRSHHLPADIAFARATKTTRSSVRVMMRGDAAWTTSTNKTEGKYRGRSLNSTGAELMVLTRTVDGWKISAVHWSSRD